MEITSIAPLYGVTNGCYVGQQDRVDELNTRIQSRQFTDVPLSPNYDPRPVPTKYALFPIIDRRKPIQEMKKSYPEYSVQHFSPMTRNGPSSTYFRNIDTETVLRNQTVALQHGADQGVYVPSTNSDLYREMDFLSTNRATMPPVHRDLFLQSKIKMSTPIISPRIGKETFYNHTRTQLRNTID